MEERIAPIGLLYVELYISGKLLLVHHPWSIEAKRQLKVKGMLSRAKVQSWQ